MKRLVLDIDENKYQTLVDFLSTLDYVSFPDTPTIVQEQIDEVTYRLEQIDQGKMEVRDWEEVKREISNK